MGDYQTLLRPTIDDDTADVSSQTSSSGSTQPKTGVNVAAADVKRSSVDDNTLVPITPYGDETLRTISLITEKFDSFRRHQQRVRSFLHSRSVTSSTRSETHRDNSICSRYSDTIKSSVATDYGFVSLPPSMSQTPEVELEGHVTASETDRVRLFYSSVASQVVVCQSLADVFLGACITASNDKVKSSSGSGVTAEANRSDSIAACTGWVHVVTGIPVLVLNTGTCSRRRRQLSLIIADRQTAFPVWRDRINYLSDYHQVGQRVHTMRVSGGLTKRVKLDIFNNVAANVFLANYQEMTSDQADELWKMSSDDDNYRTNENFRRGNSNRGNECKLLTSADISQPCDARWVTRVHQNDSSFRSAFVDFLPSTPITTIDESEDSVGSEMNEDDNAFRPRLPTN